MCKADFESNFSRNERRKCRKKTIPHQTWINVDKVDGR